jgi:hypothetical protein
LAGAPQLKRLQRQAQRTGAAAAVTLLLEDESWGRAQVLLAALHALGAAPSLTMGATTRCARAAGR